MFFIPTKLVNFGFRPYKKVLANFDFIIFHRLIVKKIFKFNRKTK
jgi:hypothetical protein